jgi:XRE family transcriptional regulator, regulator of sulfur utilization
MNKIRMRKASVPEHVKKEIGQRIRVLRLDRGMSQEELAYSSGLNRSFMGQVERGESNMTLGTLWKVGAALKVRIFELVKSV